jgi:Na+/H+ antiporter NhaD/arsenite permease-like protein
MNAVVIAIFVATYVGMAAGRVPGLQVDRTGIALVAGVALVAIGAVQPSRLTEAIHFPTLLLLAALMVISARFAAAGFYGAAASWIAAHRGGADMLLAMTVVTAGVLSAVLVNDVVVFVMTPLLCVGLAQRGLDPRPYLAALAGASNAGSAATIIGNPQNIMIGQVGALGFWKFVAVCAVPAIVALLIVFVTVRWVWREALVAKPSPALPQSVDVDRAQIATPALAVAALLALFATPLPRELSAVAVAAVLLVSRRFASRDTLVAVDWPLILLFTGLFIVNDALASTGITREVFDWLAGRGLLPDRLSLLVPLALAASNTIGNVPAVVMLLGIWRDVPEAVLYGLALMTTLAGNLFLVGSIANLIVAERAAQSGVRFGFADHLRAGVPMTLVSIVAAALWLRYGGWMTW